MKSFFTIIITFVSFLNYSLGQDIIVEYKNFSSRLGNVKVVDLNPGSITIRTSEGSRKELKYEELPIHVRHDLKVLNAAEAQKEIVRLETEKRLVHCLKPLKTDAELYKDLSNMRFVITKGVVDETFGENTKVRIARKSFNWQKVQAIVDKEGGDGQPEIFNHIHGIKFRNTNEIAFIPTKGSTLREKESIFTTLFVYNLGDFILDANNIPRKLYYTDTEEALRTLKERDISRYNIELFECEQKVAAEIRKQKIELGEEEPVSYEGLSEKEIKLLKGQFYVIYGKVLKQTKNGTLIYLGRYSTDNKKIETIIANASGDLHDELQKYTFTKRNTNRNVLIYPKLNVPDGERVPLINVYDVGIRRSVIDEDSRKKFYSTLFQDKNIASTMYDNLAEEKLREAELEKEEELRKKKEAELLAEKKRIEKRISDVKEMDPKKKLAETEPFRFIITKSKIVKSYENGTLLRISEFTKDYAKVQAIKDQGLLEVDYHDPQYGIKFSFANELIFLPFDSSEFELGEKLGLGDLHDLGAYDVVYDVGEKVNLAFGKEEVSAINPLLDIDETIIFNLRKEIAAQKAEIGIVEETEAVIESEEDNGKVKTIFGEF